MQEYSLWYVVSRSILLVVFTGTLFYGYRELYLHPCQTSQTYAIGAIDSSFRVSRDELEGVLEETEYVWEEPSGIYTMFDQVNDNADITVNLIDLEQDIVPGAAYDKGDYDRRSGELNIYQYDNTADLRLVLAHEFGHALGMGHVNDDQAIMSDILYQDAGTQPSLSSQDLAEFARVCRRI